MSDRDNKLLQGKKICKRIIIECTAKLPMCKMTYPQGIVTNIQGFPDYTKSIKQAKETLKNIQIQLNSEAVSIPPNPKGIGYPWDDYMKITIPFKTPSVNHLYFNWRGRQILTKEAKELKKKERKRER